MLLNAPLEDAVRFIEELDETGDTKSLDLSRLQKVFLSFCISAMLVVGSFCWERMERASFGWYSARALGWMLRYARIPWARLWQASVLRLVRICGCKGILVVDDSDRLRAKGTRKLFGVHKVREKKTSGYANAQNLVLLLFVTNKLTFPVGFKFFRPDPAWKAWRENDIALRLKGVKKSLRPKKPPRNPNYPMKTTLSGQLVGEFKALIPDAEISVIAADAAYLTTGFISDCESIFPEAQIISQIRKDWLVSDGKKKFARQRELIATFRDRLRFKRKFLSEACRPRKSPR
jgi:hypothetical protein